MSLNKVLFVLLWKLFLIIDVAYFFYAVVFNLEKELSVKRFWIISLSLLTFLFYLMSENMPIVYNVYRKIKLLFLGGWNGHNFGNNCIHIIFWRLAVSTVGDNKTFFKRKNYQYLLVINAGSCHVCIYWVTDNLSFWRKNEY